MLPGLEMMMACPNLAVPAEVMRHVVDVESGANPFAIGVVGGRLVRQPQNLDEAVATAQMLEAKGYNYSLGLAQVNRVNFRRYGLDTPAKAFDPCANLTAGASILADCYRSANGDWGKAFSCYYSGNFITGFLQGYVQKIYNSIVRGIQVAAQPNPAGAIPVVPNWGTTASSTYAHTSMQTAIRPFAVRHRPLSAAQRVALRSMPLHDSADASAGAASTAPSAPPTSATNSNDAPTAATASAGAATRHRPVTVHANAASDIFEPQVRGPNDLPPATTSGDTNTPQETRDSAFVF